MQEFSPIQYTKIAMANAYGLDKKNWNERLDWADEFIAGNEKYGNKLVFDLALIDADEPNIFKKSYRAYQDAMAQKPTGYIMALDATASGLQIMACLSGCHRTAEHVNLINTGDREDAYQYVANDLDVSRKVAKDPTMTHYYSSEAEPKKAFPNPEKLRKFYTALSERFPGAEDIMLDMKSLWRSDVLKNVWYLPDGHAASVKNFVAVDKKIEVDELDHATFTHRLYVNQETDYGRSLPANITHSVDGYVVREMIRRAHKQGFYLLAIHDSFWCHPNYMNNVRRNYNNILAEIADSNLFQSIARDISNNDRLIYHKKSNNLSKYIREANYSLS